MIKFIGRDRELTKLRTLYDKRIASLVVIKGRRRVGKSRLIEEFGKGEHYYHFVGLPPRKGITAQSQRDAFSRQLQKQFGTPVRADDWWDLLWYLAEHTQKGRVIICLDEISWLADQSADFLGILKTIWDDHFKKNSQLILFICGSISSWIDKNLLSSTGFVGRVSQILKLNELPLDVCNAFWGKNSHKLSAYEKFKFLAVTGGIPRYLEEIQPQLSAEENINHLAFDSGGILFNDFKQIFNDLFSSRSALYKRIVSYLADKSADRDSIAKAIGLAPSGVVSEYLDDLITAGFIARDYSWQLTTGKQSRLSLFRLSDNYLRFYLKYILPNEHKIEQGFYENISITTLPGWSTIMGLQFENLVLANKILIHQALAIRPEDILTNGSYFQRKTTRQLGVQVDYLIQTKFNNLYLCEIRFRKSAIKIGIINEMEEKIQRLKRPKGFSLRPVLIHVNGVTDEVEESQYFAKIIGFDELIAPVT